jgi:3-hydroxymyristoyl/3-hydroxydecanoyl-(acyl carrier protein) dehydratase
VVSFCSVFYSMTPHFCAFSFVDRIVSDEAGRVIVGEYQVPATISDFPLSLVSEAIGQLAAWSSMTAVDYAFRPVAGIAGAVDFAGSVTPGATLQLSAQLSQADDSAVAYDGLASINGVEVVRLHNCLGPMVPMTDFDDPELVRARYGALREGTVTPGAFPGLPPLAYNRTGSEPGQSLEGEIHIPAEAAFFGDHFPRNPVFPGTLLMHLNLAAAADLFADGDGGGASWQAVRVTDVKIRSFMLPGEILALTAAVQSREAGEAVVLVETKRGKRLTSSARVVLSPRT